MICKNCEQNINGSFCSNCGQKSNTHRINSNYLIEEITNNVLQVNRGIFFTIKQLAFKPGHNIREFLDGKRKYHFRPLAFVLLASAIYVLTTLFTGEKTILGEILSGMIRAASDNGFEKSLLANTLNWLSNNFGYSTVLLLPFFSFASYISFIKRKYNFIEHLIINCFITGQQIIIYLIFVILVFTFNIDSYYAQIIPFIIATLYTFWTFIQFFEGKIFIKILLTIITYILNIILIAAVVYSCGIIEGINTTANTVQN
jgi:hypothetical protein|tara:strand:+ start:86 stop:859 length:774 start_codon:yes stop_codon:yes gene_type:complete